MTKEEVKSFINEKITTNGAGKITGAILNQTLNNIVDMEGGDSPIISGDGENSIIQAGNNNSAISKGSIALGSDNIAGVKGWYYKKIDFTNKKIYLSATQVAPTSGTESVETFTSNFVVGNSLSIINKNKYDKQCKITAINGNCITVDSLPFIAIISVSTMETDDYSCFSIETPNAGEVDLGQNAVIIGEGCKAVKDAYAFGRDNEAYGNYAFVEGRGNKAGYGAHAEGKNTTASGQYAHSEGESTTASGVRSHSEGGSTKATNTYAHAEGGSTTASGESSHAEGNGTTASGESSHAEGNGTTASGESSHAEGGKNDEDSRIKFASRATGKRSHAEGGSTTASGLESHSEGSLTTASGQRSHAEGYKTQAIGNLSHTEGFSAIANGGASHAEGYSTRTKNIGEYAGGRYNVSNTKTDGTEAQNKAGSTQHSVGVGTSDTNRKNAFEIMQNGDIYLNGGYDGGKRAVGSTNSFNQGLVLNIVKLTKSQYEALTTKDSTTLYLITE